MLKIWYDTTLQSYFPEADETFRRNTGFVNPVGQSFHQAMTELLSGLSEGIALQEFHGSMNRIIRVLAVQGLPAGVAVRFLFVLRNQLGTNPELSADEKNIWLARLDELAEMAVEIWCECRETLFQLRINELRNRLCLLEAGSTPKERGGNA